MMYTVTVREHVMIAHSLRGELFGPAQRMHGATYVIEVELRAAQLHESGVVVDIARATDTLRSVLADLNYRNLDEHPELRGQNTTTEFLAKWIFDKLAARIAAGELGAGGQALVAMAVTLRESPVAWAGYEADLPR